MPPPSANTTTHYDSYPPVFRPKIASIHHSPPTSRNLYSDSDPLPVIDLQCLNKNKLAEACRDWGIFRLVNHGVPTKLLSQLHEHAKDLFSLSFETKQRHGFGSPMSYFWGTPGLTPSGVAIERGPNIAPNINWVEGFSVPLTLLSNLLAQKTLSHQLQDHGDDDDYPMLDAFRTELDEYGKHQSRLATTIFKAIAENLELGRELSDCYLSTSTGNTRVYRYPRCSEENRAWGIDAHTDSSVISILYHDEVGGFEVYKDGNWLPVKPIPNTLVLLLGDMMQAMSNDKYKSVKHKVKINKYEDRMSAGYFVFPKENGVIRSSNYKPFCYADFRAQVQHDLETVGYKIGLDHFKLH
ncbi:hypothetical protein ACSBR1_002276 [Camellia fascicularis]